MSFAPAKATIASELLDRLDRVADGDADASELAQIEFAAQRLRKVSPADYRMVLGLVAALREDYGAFESNFSEALDLSNHASYVVLNALLAHQEMGRFAEALKMLRDVAAQYRDVGSLELALRTFVAYGLYAEAKKVAVMLERLTGRGYVDVLKGADDIFPEMGISEDDFQQAGEMLRAFLREKGFTRVSTESYYDNCPEFGTGLVVRFDLPGTAEEVYELERSATDVLSNAGLKAVDQGVYSWYFLPNQEAPRARVLG